MKKNIFTFLTATVAATAIFLSITGLKTAEVKNILESIITKDTFTNCIFNSPFNEISEWNKPELHINSNIERYRELNFNSIQWYDNGSVRYGEPDNVLTETQRDNFRNVLDSIDEGNLYGFYERSHLGKYFYGQRLIYEVSGNDNDTGLNFGFVYKDCMDYTYCTDLGRTVLHADPQVHSSGYLCRDIYENLQHSDLFDFRQNDKGMWYIKPVMRIPTGMDDDIPVVRIEVVAFNGIKVKEIIIKTDNFKDELGNYNGDYLEKYDLQLGNLLEISGETTPVSLNNGRTEDWKEWNTACKVDFRVFWYGECNVWFDKMIVDDVIANDLFNPLLQSANNYRIQQEVNYFTNYGSMHSFFVDEVLISQYPCLKYVADRMKLNRPAPKLSIAVTNYLHIHGLRNDNLSYGVYMDSIQPDFLQCDHHGFSESIPKIPNVLTGHDGKIPSGWFDNAYNYNLNLQNYVFGSTLDAGVPNEVGSLIYEIKKTKDNINQYSPGIKFIMQPQIHGWLFRDTNSQTEEYKNGLREPTNEEIQAQAMLSIAHGADGLCWFVYNSHTWMTSSGDKIKFSMLGLLDPEDDISERYINCYGQNKWDSVSSMNEKILNWIPVLYNTNWINGFSVHNQGANHYFIEDIKSIYRDPSGMFIDGPSCPNCDDNKYWEEGFFNPADQSDRSRYVLMVNRRCFPEEIQGTGDIRQLKIKFKLSELAGFNNWIIKDVNTGQQITFDKNNQGSDGFLNLGSSIGDMGYFNPGEGKLFQIAPVMQEGGTFVCNEDVAGSQNFFCRANVFTNGYDLKINNGVTINFFNNTGIYINNTQYLDIYTVEFKGYNNENWAGLNITNSRNITIQGATFRNIVNGSKAVDIQNSTDDGIIFINSCNFYLGSSSITAGGIRAISLSEENILSPVYLYSNNFYCTNTNRAIEINPMGCDGCSCDIYNNNILSQSGNCNTAIFLSNVNAAGIWENTVSGFLYGIAGINSTLYLDSNEITSARSQAYGVFGASQSNLYLTDVGGYVAAGENNISTTGIQGKNIKLTESNFDLDNGYNTLNITDYQNQEDKGYHIYGTIPDLGDLPPDTIFERKNCFKIDAQQTFNPAVYVVRNGSPLNCFYYLPFECQNPNLPIADEYVVSMPGGYNDTIRKYETNIQIPEAEQIYHLMYKSLRFKNYDDVKIKSALLLTNYLNNIYAPDVISKLYLSSIKTDTNQTAVLQTKNFLEQLILSNPGKLELVKSAFYFIQKCKIYLEQYSSALTGLEEIINQNPYSYAGLIASWDYSATLLLIDTTLGTGGEKDICITGNLNIEERNSDTLRTRKLTKFDSYDRKVFTKNDRSRLAEVIVKTNNNDVNGRLKNTGKSKRK